MGNALRFQAFACLGHGESAVHPELRRNAVFDMEIGYFRYESQRFPGAAEVSRPEISPYEIPRDPVEREDGGISRRPVAGVIAGVFHVLAHFVERGIDVYDDVFLPVRDDVVSFDGFPAFPQGFRDFFPHGIDRPVCGRPRDHFSEERLECRVVFYMGVYAVGRMSGQYAVCLLHYDFRFGMPCFLARVLPDERAQQGREVQRRVREFSHGEESSVSRQVLS